MKLIEYPASKEASGLIECLWYIPANQSLSLIPDGIYSDIIGEISLSKPQGLNQHSYNFLCLPLLKQAVLIQTKSPVLVIRKKAFIHLSNKNSRNFTQSLQEYISKLKNNLELKRLDEICKHLCGMYAENYYRLPVLTQLINEILSHKGQIRLTELYSSLHLSKQSVSKTYASKIEMSLKELSTIWRLNDFLINMQSSTNLSQAFVDAGFFDQAHGIKYFKKYYNISPSAFQLEHQDKLPAIISPIEKRFKGLYDPIIG